MNEFKTTGTPKTPEITGRVDDGKVLIKGICIPEDARNFFLPFRDWLLEFTEKTDQKINVEVDLEYFNTSTSNILLDVFKHLNRTSEKKEVNITWVYEEDDVDMKEVGEDYQIMVGDIIKLRSKSILN